MTTIFDLDATPEQLALQSALSPSDLAAEWRAQATSALAHLESDVAWLRSVPRLSEVGRVQLERAEGRLTAAAPARAALEGASSPREVARAAAPLARLSAASAADGGAPGDDWAWLADQLACWAWLAAGEENLEFVPRPLAL